MTGNLKNAEIALDALSIWLETYSLLLLLLLLLLGPFGQAKKIRVFPFFKKSETQKNHVLFGPLG